MANKAIVGGCIRVILNIYICQKTLRFLRSDIIQLLNDTLKFQSDVVEIMQNLEEAIITRSSGGIGFCNKLGFKIMHDIKASKISITDEANPKVVKKGQSLDLFESLDQKFYKDLDFGVFHDIGSPVKTEKMK